MRFRVDRGKFHGHDEWLYNNALQQTPAETGCGADIDLVIARRGANLTAGRWRR